MEHNTKNVFIVWRAYQGRVEAMQPIFNYKTFYLGLSFRRIFRIAEYLIKTFHTAYILVKEWPQIVWAQIPPTFIIHFLALYKTVNRKACVVADCHNSVFKPPWIRVPYLFEFLNKYADVVLVHNYYVFNEALQSGIDTTNYCVLETRPTEPTGMFSVSRASSDFVRPWVLFPASFDKDEPLDLLFEVANTLPEITFVITGNLHRARGRHDLSKAASNIIFTGWVSKEQYLHLIASTDVVIGLTLFEGVQLSVANEAAGFGKAMVLSDTQVLRHLFPKGAIYVKSDPRSFHEGIQTAIQRKAELELASRQLKEDRIQRWDIQAATLKTKLDVIPISKTPS